MTKALPLIIFAVILFACKNKTRLTQDKYDGPAAIAAMEYKKTKDPATGRVPREKLVPALEYADFTRNIFNRVTAAGTWTERGPNSDVVGSSNGNTRANSGVASGRIRAILVDANDATGKTVWVGGVNGGLWKTTDISLSPATWTPQSDFFSNMAVTSICQNPAAPQTMYFATGEWCFNGDAVAGDGIWKSTNGGTTWTQLSSTTSASFDYCSKILCDASGNVYVSTRSGIFRSTDAGTTWTTITPSGLATSRFSDMELSSTGRLHVSAGQFSSCAYRFTSSPSTVTSATWTSATSGFPSSSVRIELACSASTLYALPVDGSYQVPTIYKSTDGGANWAATTGQPTAGWASGQGWYALGAAVNPADVTQVIVGGLEAYKTTDGGATWTRISRWVGTTGQYVHADIHNVTWYSTNRVLFGCDGGIHYSGDDGTTIRDRNVGLRIKQFYSCDAHPSSTNVFIAGAQDNGNHQFNTAGLGATTEVTGGDGAYVRVDQDAGNNMFGAYVYNVFRRSTTTGSSWSTCTFYKGSPGTYNVNYFDFGQFINPFDYDNTNNIIYGAADGGEFFRWTTPLTTSAGTYYSSTTFASANAEILSLTSLGANFVTAVTVSPYTNHKVYFGTDNGTVVYATGANTIATGSAGTSISTGLPAGTTTSCIATGTNDNNLMVSFSDYGVSNVWVSTNGGTSWTAIDGNLPNMPVRWCMFYPGDNTRAIIATEAGVWITELINGGSTSWYVSPTFPLVRTDMIRYRSSDNIFVAATHGRGLWTQSATTIFPLDDLRLTASWSGSANRLQWSYPNATANTKFEVLASFDGTNFSKVGNAGYNGSTNYSFDYTPTQSKIFYRIRAIEYNAISKYSNIAKLDKNINQFELWAPSPNPVGNDLAAQYNSNITGNARFDIVDASGKTVQTGYEKISNRGTNYFRTSIGRLSRGSYTLIMYLNGYKAVQKFVKA